jgi:uncharacterized protein (DUF2249 family)
VSWLGGALKQPLAHFALLGIAVFLVDHLLSPEHEVIDISPATRREVATRLEQSLGRPPTEGELWRGLEEWIDTELLFREAIALGLDENDAVIRDHLARKLEHIVKQRSILAPPSEAELLAQFEAAPERYTGPETFDLTHVFIQSSATPATHRQRVDDALAELAAGAEPRSVGDHFPRGPKFTRMMKSQLEQIFQTKLSEALEAEHIGTWQAHSSRRGTHLVRLDAIFDGTRDFDSLRPALTEDIQEEKKQAALQSYLGELRKKHAIDSKTRP